jgi:hypothetical protein
MIFTMQFEIPEEETQNYQEFIEMVLTETRIKVDEGLNEGVCRDINGNTIGDFYVG